MARLPSAYQEVEWIQSDGECWLNANFMPNGQTSVYGRLMIPTGGTDQNRWIWGCGADWNRNVFEFSTDVSTYHGFAWDYGANTGGGRLGSTPKAEHIYSVEQVKNILKIIDETAGTTSHNTSYFGEQTFNTNMNMLIFSSSRGSDSPTSPKIIMRLWYLKIYDNGTLVRDMIPCYRKSDNEIGMYDIVNDVFYTNQGTGTFSKGPNTINFPDFRAVKNFYIGEEEVIKISTPSGEVLWETWLPPQYQEVEYIRGVSSEGPYIDTDFTTTLTMKMEADAKCNGLGDCVLATMPISASTNSNFSLGRYNGTTAYMCWNGREIGGGDWSTRKTMIAYQDDGTIYRQLGEDVSSISVSLQTLSTPSKLWLFRRNDGGTPSTSSGDVTLYGCKLYDNNILQRHFIPCYRKSDNEIGLYDRVTKTFFTNQGTGTFTKGPDVT